MPESVPTSSILKTILRGRIWLFASVVAWLIAAAIYLSVRTPVYEAVALLQAPEASFSNETDIYTAAEKLRRLPLYNTVLQDLHGFDTAEAFQKATSVRVQPRTALIRLAVRHPEKVVAELLTSRLESAARVSDGKKKESYKNFHRDDLVLLDPVYSIGPVNPSVPLVIVGAIACGIVCGLGIICLRNSI